MYLSWQFAVGPAGDFADLAGRLEALAVGEASDGFRLVDVSRPFPADPRVSPEPTIALQGALRPTGSNPAGTLSATMADALAARLATSINESPGDNEAPVAPPLYGGRQAERGDVVPPVAADDWLAQLNLDARRRLAAGRGAHYVRAHQEELMAKAWDDAGAIRAANRFGHRPNSVTASRGRCTADTSRRCQWASC